jgi:hypothetical protein
VAEAGDPEQCCGVEDVGADDLGQRQREDEHHDQPEERAAADRGQADDEAADGADRERDEAVAAGEQERCVVRLHAALDEGLRDEPDTADHERNTDRVRLDVLGAARVVTEPRGDDDAEQRHRARPEEHPEGQARVHRPEPPVPDRAEALEDGAV